MVRGWSLVLPSESLVAVWESPFGIFRWVLRPVYLEFELMKRVGLEGLRLVGALQPWSRHMEFPPLALAIGPPVADQLSEFTGTSKDGVIVLVGVAGYGCIWWKGWKLPDLMLATRWSLSDACSTIAKQLESVHASIALRAFGFLHRQKEKVKALSFSRQLKPMLGAC